MKIYLILAFILCFKLEGYSEGLSKRKNHQLICKNSSEDSTFSKPIIYQHHVALSIDIFNFFTSSLYFNLEIPINKNNSITVSAGTHLFQGIDVKNTSTTIKKPFERDSIIGLGFRHYFLQKKNGKKSPFYVQPQFLIGNALFYNSVINGAYSIIPYKSAAINLGYNLIEHRGLFYGFDIGAGLQKAHDTEFWFRIGFEAGFAF